MYQEHISNPATCSLYAYQLQRGRHFLHEHPWGAKLWNMERLGQLIGDPRVMVAKADMCRLGLETTDTNGQSGTAGKRTGFLTSSWTPMEELNGLCDGRHGKHNHLTDGRAKDAVIYPPELCRAICRGISRQKNLDATNTNSSQEMTRGQVPSVVQGSNEEGWSPRRGRRQRPHRP